MDVWEDVGNFAFFFIKIILWLLIASSRMRKSFSGFLRWKKLNRPISTHSVESLLSRRDILPVGLVMELWSCWGTILRVYSIKSTNKKSGYSLTDSWVDGHKQPNDTLTAENQLQSYAQMHIHTYPHTHTHMHEYIICKVSSSFLRTNAVTRYL